MDVQGGEILELRADGTASMVGEETVWSASGYWITIGPDAIQYSKQFRMATPMEVMYEEE